MGTAFADDPPPVEEASTFVPSWTSQASLEAALEESDPAISERPPTNSEAAETLPHEDLGREEAVDLLTSVFGEVLDEPASVFDELDIRSFRSDYVAVIGADDPSEEPGLLSSSLPLRTESDQGLKEPVELGLESAEGELQPQNPLVDVGIPTQIQDGITLPEAGISIELVGAPAERSPSSLGDSAVLYPNVATESDLAVTPTPTGVETFTQLRSPDADHAQRFRLELPVGAVLEAAPDGGAVVVKGDSTLLRVPPPSAIDAEGSVVPVSLAVEDDSMIVTAAPTSAHKYPLLVDPIFETYFWDWYPNDHSPEWVPASNSNRIFASWTGWAGPGLKLWSDSYAQITPGQANWNYYVPRFFADKATVGARPTSYIKEMQLANVMFTFSGSQPHPWLLMGLWSENKNEWVSVGTRTGAQGQLTDPNFWYKFVNPDEVTDVQNGGIALASSEAFLPTQRKVSVGMATVEISDKDDPFFGTLGSAPNWVHDQETSAINYRTTDMGLGIYQLQIQKPLAQGGTGAITISAQCDGSARNPCPRTLEASQRALAYDPKTMPHGENWVQVSATDPVGHKTPIGDSRVKVDHLKPTLNLSGTLTEQAKVGTNLSQYNLKYDASDGKSVSAEAQTPFGSLGSGNGQLNGPRGIAADGKGNVWVVDRGNNRVVKFSESGEYLGQFGSTGSGNGQFNSPFGITITSEGKLWVADTGNDRLQQFSSSGQYLQQFGTKTSLVSSGTAFIEPQGVAAGPGGTLWVSDGEGRRVAQFNEDPSKPRFIRNVSGIPGFPGMAADLKWPIGLAVDASGNVWVAERNNNRVQQYNATGKFVNQFGTAGAGNGQINALTHLAITPSGNLLVVDTENHRIQEFEASGQFIRKFGTLGTGNGNLSEPRGIAFGAGDVAFIADKGNNRVTRWAHADYDPQSGVASTEVKIDGNLVEPQYAPGCATRNCTISREWWINVDNYAVGQHSVEVTATDGVGLSTTKSLTVETHGDLTPPSVALSGSMTEQEVLGTTRPAYVLKVNATDPGGADERKSGVVRTTIKVDGKIKDTIWPGCPAGGCSISREWTLSSNSYTAGAHTVEVTAMDAVGRVTTKTLAITINRDATPPQITATNNVFTAPEGWVEQHSYPYTPSVSDINGYGVTSFIFKIDGAIVKSATQTCPSGGCGSSLSGSVDMSTYDGGAHPAELVATDGAGNVAKKAWTINVDPAGHITVGEAEDTLEAVDTTSPVNSVGESQTEDDYEGTLAGLELAAESGDFTIIGSAAPTSISTSPTEGLTVETTNPLALGSYCFNEGEEAHQEFTGAEEEALDPSGSAVCPDVGATPPYQLTPVEVEPLGVSPSASANHLADSQAAAISANVAPHVDLITRPLFDGAMQFAAIRDANAPESFSWRVELEEDQELKLLDQQHAAVYYTDGHHGFSITAGLAHDAVGSAVPTTISVTMPNIITLTVNHRAASPAGGGFVYPVVAGTGWEGGFQTYQIAMPGETEYEGPIEGGEGGEVAAGTGYLKTLAYGPPELTRENLISGSSIPERSRAYVFNSCRWIVGEGVPVPSGGIKTMAGRASQQCHNPANPGTGDFVISWAVAIYGRFYYKYGHKVAIRHKPECSEWGGSRPAQVHCYAKEGWTSNWKINLLGDFRFRPGKYLGPTFRLGRSVCFQLNGVLPIRPQPSANGERIYHENAHEYLGSVWPEDPCPWGNLEYGS